jgi:MraZ protein
MFSGTSVYTVDPKGRVTMPKEFRALLGEPFVLTKGLGGCLLAVSQEHWDKILERYSTSVTFQRFYLSAAHPAKAHPRTGRFLVPAPLREFARVRPGADVAVVGIAEGVEVWDKARWDKLSRELPRGVCRQDATFELSVEEPEQPAPFNIRPRSLFGITILECSGEPDVSAAARLSELLDQEGAGVHDVILDVRLVPQPDAMLAGMRFNWPEDKWRRVVIVAPEATYGFFDQYLGFSRPIFPNLEEALWHLAQEQSLVES